MIWTGEDDDYYRNTDNCQFYEKKFLIRLEIGVT